MEKNINNTDYFPRVLLVKHLYSIKNGGGITVNNFFSNWPVDKFAISAQEICIDKNVKWEKFYQLGSKEEFFPFPLNLLKRHTKYSGVIKKNEILNIENIPFNKTNSKNIVVKTLKKIVKNIFQYLGYYLFLTTRNVLSNDYINWIKEFNPEILYVFPVNYETASFYLKIHEILKIPMAVHIVDDYKNRTKSNLFYYCFERRNNSIFKKLVSQAELNLSISDEMSDAFFERFGKKFYAFHNPVNLNLFNNYLKKNWEYSNEFKILYSSNINECRELCIYNICKAVELINSENLFKVVFDIVTPIQIKNTYWGRKYSKFNNVVIHDPITNQLELLKKLSSYDLLLIVVDFEKRPIDYCRHSYSTNTAEYMASGTPILIYASPEIDFVKSAKKNQWAYVVEEENVDNLKDHILKLINDSNLRERIAKNAMSIAKDKDEINKVQSSLKSLFIETIKKGI